MQKILLFSYLLLWTSYLRAQASPLTTLHRDIMHMDSLLFQAGFNDCHTAILDSIVADDLEFYHDQSGITRGKQAFISSIEQNICGLAYRPLRKLLPATHRVYPLTSKGELYGAIQRGTHEFFALEGEGSPYFTSVAQFTHLWLKRQNRWYLKRVLSYDHHDERSPTLDVTDRASVEQFLQQQRVPGLAIAVIKNRQLQQVAVYGRAAADQPVSLSTLFNVASLTKPVVSLLTLTLVDRGEWDLDAPLYPLWVDPDVADDPNARLLTTRHILSHQSGFANWRWEHPDGKLRFTFPPGTDHQYSGEGFAYLQQALENKFDRSLEKLADSLLFQPLAMTKTHFTWNDQAEKMPFAAWHDTTGITTYPNYKTYEASAADDLLTTIGDYSKLVAFVLQGAGLSDALFADMVRPQRSDKHSISMGLGWEILPQLRGDQYALLHTGGDRGVNTLAMMLPKTGEGLVVFTNGDHGNKLFFPLVRHYLSLGKEINRRAP